MADQENGERSLQQRVNEILQLRNASYIVEEIESNSVSEIVEQLREAEKELKQVQHRIARLRGLLTDLEPDKYS